MRSSNKMKLIIPSLSINEAFARSAVAAFCVELNPTIEELNDIKTAVSEAVTNSIVHAYKEMVGDIQIETLVDGNSLHIIVTDYGVGIKDIDAAMQPFFTTAESDERSGMGFTVMQTFMDNLNVSSEEGKGTVVIMSKIISKAVK